MFRKNPQLQGLFQKKEAATAFKTRLSLKEKAEGLLTHGKCENTIGDLGSCKHIFPFSFILLRQD